MECRTDAWNIDICVTGSQKALMLPPGLAYVAVSDKAWATDPQGVRWETFRTTGDLTVYGVGALETEVKQSAAAEGAAASACCSV